MPEKRTYKMREGHFYKNIVRKGGAPIHLAHDEAGKITQGN